VRNLAGDPDCDSHIALELLKAGIPAVIGERYPGEVAATVTGQLGKFAFRRAWYYWVAEGPMPVRLAREIHAHQFGAMVRVNGNCTCPAPDGHQVEWYDETGRQVLDIPRREEAERFLKGNSKSLREIARKILDENRFEEDPSRFNGFVMLYHIDTQEGLNLFTEMVQKIGGEPSLRKPGIRSCVSMGAWD
jgi:hypothetical protein